MYFFKNLSILGISWLLSKKWDVSLDLLRILLMSGAIEPNI